MLKRIEDWLLYRLQRRCEHPSDMIAADVLEGSVDGMAVKYCRRCGSIKTDWDAFNESHVFAALDHCWRTPDPYLWRG